MDVNSLDWVQKTLTDRGELLRGELFGCGDKAWFGATIDTRANCKQRLFFAMKGEKTDGHRFVAAALDRGAAAVVVENKKSIEGRHEGPYMLVRNSLRALQELSQAYRETLDIRIVAVTGSSGKTTTKEYIRAMLKKKYRVHSNPGNLNNHIGVPLTLLDTDHDMEYLVSEVGANHAGEIDFLSRILKPDIGVIVNVGDAHIGLFGSRDQIAEAKAELFSGIDEGGYAILPQDDDYIDMLSGRAGRRVVTFGYGDASTFRVTAVEETEGAIHFQVNGEPMSINSFGAYNVLNAAAALAVGDLCGVETERVREALAEFEPMPGRARIYRARGITLVDDSYNANPTTMRAAVTALAARPATRRLVILGDMAELGAYSDEAHCDLGAFIGRSGIDAVFWLGKQAPRVKKGMKKSKVEFRGFDEIPGLVASISDTLRSGDLVLVKASRGAALDRVVDELRQTTLKETDC